MPRVRFAVLFLAASAGLLSWMPHAFAAPEPSDDCIRGNRRLEARAEAKCFAIQHGGRTRTFRLYLPARDSDRPRPLLLALHGGGGFGSAMERLAQFQFNRIADRDGIVVAYPDGIEKGWNDGRNDLRTTATKENVDDVGYLRALPAEIAALTRIDMQRVYVTGISNGGFMSFRLACDAAEVFAAAAPVSANFAADLEPHCRPSRPISIAIVNGTEDPLVPWEGGEVKVFGSRRGKVWSARATVDRWLELDRCGELRSDAPVDRDADDGTTLLRHFASCAQGTQVVLYEVRGGGHTWPSGRQYLPQLIVGRVTRELDTETIWNFLRQFRLPGK